MSMNIDIFEAGYNAGEVGPCPTQITVTQMESLVMALVERACLPLRTGQLFDAARIAARLLGWKVGGKDPQRAFCRLSLHGQLQLHPDYTVTLGRNHKGLKGVDSGP